MLSLYVRLGVLLLCATTVLPAGRAATSSSNVHNKREADYTLDDSYWNQESPVGEVERLLRDYRQNQELVRNIGANYYQIIYPVQIRHHDKMGISTREVGSQKFPSSGLHGSSEGYSSGGSFRPKSRMGKHFHRTSILIKAFNHKFRLDLELNTQLLAPNLAQKHFLPHGAEQVSKQEIEHCYYHGTVKDIPGATAAFHTCNGVAGVIHIGNETFIIHPFYGGDLSKHPHVIFEARDKAKRGCANDLRPDRKNKYTNGFTGGRFRKKRRLKRDVREVTKYIETALVLDKAMFEMRNGSSRSEVITDAIQIANIADLYFRTINTRVSVVYIETWQGANQALIDKNKEISTALLNFNEYSSHALFNIGKDTAQLLTGEYFVGGETGMAIHGTVCTAKSVGISVDVNAYEPHIIAGSMAHMIGHNVGMGHDDKREECYCRDWHGCIMQQSIVGMENIQPYKFSDCSLNDYIDEFRETRNMCLLNKPNEVTNLQQKCGNNIVEDNEECDCGGFDNCQKNDPCCDPITCKLIKEAECSASGTCCSDCKFLAMGTLCRAANNECDLPEHCTGDNGQCPADMYKKNASPCGTENGFCYMGECPTLNAQCELIWGYGGVSSDRQCYDEFNTKGSMSGNCGMVEGPGTTTYLKCDQKNVYCGSLQCQKGTKYPQNTSASRHTKTVISIESKDYECKSTSGSKLFSLVQDGTPCGDNLICINQTCTSMNPYIDTHNKCPSNHNNLECSAHGICSNLNQCFCDNGWTGNDCSIQLEISPTSPNSADVTLSPEDAKKAKSDLESKMIMKETPYDTHSEHISTLGMVVILSVAVKFVFISFALLAICYRRSSEKQATDKQKQSINTTPVSKPSRFDAPSEESAEEMAMVNINRINKYGNQSPYNRSETGSHKMLFHPTNHMSPSTSGISMEHKSQNLSRLGLCPNDEDDMNVQENLHMSGRGSSCGLAPGSVSISDMERKIKSLDGYHGDLLEKLRTAAHRSSSGARSSSEDLLWRTLTETAESAYNRITASQERLCEERHGLPQSHTVLSESGVPTCHRHPYRRPSRRTDIAPEDEEETAKEVSSTIRIRNLEDLFKQIQEHTVRHSPSGSEENRMSETEVDRHYRHDAHPGCEEPRFVRGWYRPASRATSGSASPYQQAAARASSATVHSTTARRPIARSASMDMPAVAAIADNGVRQPAAARSGGSSSARSSRRSSAHHQHHSAYDPPSATSSGSGHSPSPRCRQRRNGATDDIRTATATTSTIITANNITTAADSSSNSSNNINHHRHHHHHQQQQQQQHQQQHRSSPANGPDLTTTAVPELRTALLNNKHFPEYKH
ncbi:disintegrin and metalloproteinase domain-containing protein unc-71 isoform X4 [Rhopalosiphum padi]|uniref:disintegrin and metalloproteinase domain-containing protein unc-71 isoform X4 n=1 Tax=Rhopalosiphum padi TaxID=40932 RepID=UPI00298E9831|nr:disintegrin and metalloproteinase domain-containing protein unc-71 isoform X4 [Rhopalosiphum padi]